MSTTSLLLTLLSSAAVAAPAAPVPPSDVSAYAAAVNAVSAMRSMIDRPAHLTLADGRVIDAVLIARAANGWIVSVDGDVVTFADGSYRNMQIDLTTRLPTDRRAAIDARLAALEARHRPTPAFATTDLLVGDSPVIGPRDAATTVTAFIDPLSSSSGAVLAQLKSIVDDPRILKRVRVAVKHVAIPESGRPRDIARLMLAVHALAGDDLYFKVASRIAADIGGATPLAVLFAAEQLGISRTTLASTARSDVAALDAKIEADLALAVRIGATRSPTLFVNGRRLDTLDVDGLIAHIAEHP